MEQATYDRKRADLRHDPKTRACLLVRFFAALVLAGLIVAILILKALDQSAGLGLGFLTARNSYVLPIASIVYFSVIAGSLFAMKSRSEQYRKAAWLNLGAAAVQAVSTASSFLIPRFTEELQSSNLGSKLLLYNVQVFPLAFALATIVLCLAALSRELLAHSETMEELDPELTHAWLDLRSHAKLFLSLSLVYIPLTAFVGIGLFALASMLHLIDLIPILLFLSLLVPYVGFALYFIVRYFVLLKRTRNVYTATMEDAVRVETAYAEELQKRIEANPLLRNSAK